MTIDLSLLPAPAVVEALDYETLLAARKAALIALWPAADQPAIAATLALETEPLTKLLEENTYRELLLRARINDAAHACMLAYASGPDLDNLGGLYGLVRFTLTPANPGTTPPTAAVMETDTDFRARIQLAPEGLTVAGSRSAYQFHALNADPDVKSVAVANPTPGTVRITVLSRTGDGTAGAPLLGTVSAALSAETVRPLCDTVLVQSASITPYTITGVLNVLPGPSAQPILDAAMAAAQAAAAQLHSIGRDVSRSAIYAALHQPGCYRVDLDSPAADIVIDETHAAYCTAITLTLGTIGE